MRATEIKDLNQLKSELEKQTDYEFTIKENILGNKVLYLQGLPKKTEIKIYIGNYRETERQYIGVDGSDNRDGYGGFGCPCDTISKVIETLNYHSQRYGYVASEKQLSLGV